MTAGNVHYLIWMSALVLIVVAIAVSWAYARTHDGEDDEQGGAS